MTATHQPVEYDLKIFCGATWRTELSYANGPGSPTPGPIDMAGWTAKMQVRATRGNGVTEAAPYGTLMIELTTSNGGIVLNADSTPGRIRLQMPASDTTQIIVSPARYDLELTTNTGDVIRLMMGEALISEQVTL